MALEGVKFDAFISYRHCEKDSFVSEQLHKRLEEYKLPKSVVKKHGLTRNGISRVFRDEAELPLSENLSDPINVALKNSEFLIVVCTPRLPESLWCRKEVETFVETHDRKHVLLVLAEGEPDESFPEILTYEDRILKDENGHEVKVRTEREPLAADCRGENKKEILKALDDVVLRLVAAIFGLNYDDLKQRHRERQLKRRRIAFASVMAVVTVFALTCLFFMLSIRKRNLIIQDKYAGAMAAASEELLEHGMRMDALYAARSVLPDREKDGFNSEAYRALVKALAPYEIESSYFPVKSFPVSPKAAYFFVSEDASVALFAENEQSIVVDTESGEELYRVDSLYADISGHSLIWIDDGDALHHRELLSGEEKKLMDRVGDMIVAPGGGVFLALAEDELHVYRGDTELFAFPYGELGVTENAPLAGTAYLSEDGEHVAFSLLGSFNSWIVQLHLADGSVELVLEVPPRNSCVFATDGSRLYFINENTDLHGTEGINSVMEAYDVASGTMLAETTLPGNGFYRILPGTEGILLVSDRLAYIMDEDLNMLSSISGYRDAVCTFCFEDGFGLIDGSGEFFYGDAQSNYSLSHMIYGHEDAVRVSYAAYIDDRFFIRYTGDRCVVIYEKQKELPAAAEENGPEAKVSGGDDEGKLLEGLEGIGGISVFGASRSGDGKYTVVIDTEDTLHVFDAEGRAVRVIYDAGVFLSENSFPWLEEAQVYVLENALYDRDFRRIADLPRCTFRGPGADGKSLIVSSIFDDSVYRIPILTYEEMIGRVDAVLKDHVPEDWVREKYSME